MNTETLNQMLLDAVPEMKAEFLDFVSWQDSMKTSEYTTYGFLFVPFFVRAIEQKTKMLLAVAQASSRNFPVLMNLKFLILCGLESLRF